MTDLWRNWIRQKRNVKFHCLWTNSQFRHRSPSICDKIVSHHRIDLYFTTTHKNVRDDDNSYVGIDVAKSMWHRPPWGWQGTSTCRLGVKQHGHLPKHHVMPSGATRVYYQVHHMSESENAMYRGLDAPHVILQMSHLSHSSCTPCSNQRMPCVRFFMHHISSCKCVTTQCQ